MPTRTRVEVPALCEFSHEGRRYVRGEMVSCTPVEASILARQGKVSLTREYATRDVTADTKPTRRRAGSYRRRDMRAED